MPRKSAVFATLLLSILLSRTAWADPQRAFDVATDCQASFAEIRVNSRTSYMPSCEACMNERPGQVFLYDSSLDRCVLWTEPLGDPQWDSDPTLQADACTTTNVLQAIQAIKVTNAITQSLARCRPIAVWRNSTVTLDQTYVRTNEVARLIVDCLCAAPYREYSYALVVASAQENVLHSDCGTMCRTERKIGGASTLVHACTGRDMVPGAVTAEAAAAVCQAARRAWSDARQAGLNRVITYVDARVAIYDCLHSVRSVGESWNIQTQTYNEAAQRVRRIGNVTEQCKPYSPPGEVYAPIIKRQQEVRFEISSRFSPVHSTCTAKVNLDVENTYAPGDQESTDGLIDPILIDEITPAMLATGLTRHANVTFSGRRAVHFSCAGNPRLVCLGKVDGGSVWGNGVQLQEKLGEVRWTQKIPSLSQMNISDVGALFRLEKATEASTTSMVIDVPIVLNATPDEEGFIEIAPDDITVRFSAAEVNRKLCDKLPRVNTTVRYFQTPPQPRADRCDTPWVRRRAQVYAINVTDVPFFTQEYQFPSEGYRHSIDLEIDIEPAPPTTEAEGKLGRPVVYPTHGLNRLEVAPRTYLVARDANAGDRANVSLEIVGRRFEQLNHTGPPDYCFRRMHQFLTVNTESSCGAWRHEVLMQLPGVLEVPISHGLIITGFGLPSQVTLSRTQRRNDEVGVANYIAHSVANSWRPLMQNQYMDPRSLQIRVDAILQTPVHVVYSANRSLAQVEVKFCVPDCPLECVSRTHSMRVSGGSTAAFGAYYGSLPIRSESHKRAILQEMGLDEQAAETVTLKFSKDPARVLEESGWVQVAAEQEAVAMNPLEIPRKENMRLSEWLGLFDATASLCKSTDVASDPLMAAMHNFNRSVEIHACSYLPGAVFDSAVYDIRHFFALAYSLSNSALNPPALQGKFNSDFNTAIRSATDWLDFGVHNFDRDSTLVTCTAGDPCAGMVTIVDPITERPFRMYSLHAEPEYYAAASGKNFPSSNSVTQSQCDVEVDMSDPESIHITLPFILHPRQATLGKLTSYSGHRSSAMLVPDPLAFAKIITASCTMPLRDAWKILHTSAWSEKAFL